MSDTYLYLIREPDWDSDQMLSGEMTPDLNGSLDGRSRRFAEAVEKLGAEIVGGEALQNSKYGGVVKLGEGDRAVEDAVYTDSSYVHSPNSGR